MRPELAAEFKKYVSPSPVGQLNDNSYSLLSARPELNTEHILIGRKEPRKPTMGGYAPRGALTTTAAQQVAAYPPRPQFTRSSSPSSSASFQSAHSSGNVHPKVREAELVIETLFNPTVFKEYVGNVNANGRSLSANGTSSSRSRSTKGGAPVTDPLALVEGIGGGLPSNTQDKDSLHPTLERSGTSQSSHKEWEVISPASEGITPTMSRSTPDRKGTVDSLASINSGSSRVSGTAGSNSTSANSTPSSAMMSGGEGESPSQNGEEGRGRWFKRFVRPSSRAPTPTRDQRTPRGSLDIPAYGLARANSTTPVAASRNTFLGVPQAAGGP